MDSEWQRLDKYNNQLEIFKVIIPNLQFAP